MLTDLPWWLINTVAAVVLLALGVTLALWGMTWFVRTRRRVQELEERRGLLQNLVRSIPDLVWLKDTDGVYLACNAPFERFFGAAEADIVGKTDADGNLVQNMTLHKWFANKACPGAYLEERMFDIAAKVNALL